MPLVRKPKEQTATPQNVEAFIHGGGSEPGPAIAVVEEATQTVTVRIPKSLLGRVDACVKGRLSKPSRHQWILDAIAAQVERDEDA